MAKKILIAEDEIEILKMFTDMLQAAGFMVTGVSDGNQAIAKIANENFDLILLDIQMPEKDGFGVLEYMQAQGLLPKMKVIILSNIDEPKWIKRAKELGALDYWLKVDTHLVELINKVKNLFI
jgi:DNA-binding response OmpR family regulator